MKKVDLYVVMAEVEALEGSELYDRCDGAYVNVFSPAGNPDDALGKARESLEADHYRLVRVERCCPVNLDAWDNPEYREEIEEEGVTQSDLLRAIATGEVVYGLFEMWDDDDGDVDVGDEEEQGYDVEFGEEFERGAEDEDE